MSKLYKKYMELKKSEPNKLYLFKAGIFFIFLDSDAKLVSSELNLKLTKLNDNVVKCGFPVSNLSKYTELLNINHFEFVIIDEKLNSVNSITDYLNDTNIISYVTKIKTLNIDKTSPIQAFNILSDFKKLLEGVNNENK